MVKNKSLAPLDKDYKVWFQLVKTGYTIKPGATKALGKLKLIVSIK